MLKLLIVDDEPIILEAMQKVVDWHAIGYEIVGAAANGVEALKIVKAMSPDVIITDIVMERMDGFELIKAVKNINEDIFFVVLSAYQEFEYAQEACNLGVSSYLLKPCGSADITCVMASLAEKMHEERHIKDILEKYEDLIGEDTYLLAERFVKCLVYGKVSYDEMQDWCRLQHISIEENSKYAAVLVKAQPDNEGSKMMPFALKKIVQQILGSKYNVIATYLEDDQLCTILWDKETNMLCHDELDNLMLRIRTMVNKLLSVNTTVARGQIADKIEEIKVSYMEAMRAMEHSLTLGNNVVLTADDIKDFYNQVPVYPLHMEIGILNTALSHDLAAFNMEFDKCITLIKSNNYENAYIWLYHIFVLVTKELMESDGLHGEKYGRMLQSVVFSYGNSIDEFAQTIKRSISDMISRRMERQSTYMDEIIKKVMEIVDECIYDNNVTLRNVSKRAYLSPAYLGQVFKKVIGKSFSEYITYRKINEARRLLANTDEKIISIAEKVGYDNYPYFCVLFKKSTGLTPLEHRKQYSGKKECPDI